MRTGRVFVSPALLEDDLGYFQRVEDLAIDDSLKPFSQGLPSIRYKNGPSVLEGPFLVCRVPRKSLCKQTLKKSVSLTDLVTIQRKSQ